jgi:hypothetical protein
MDSDPIDRGYAAHVYIYKAGGEYKSAFARFSKLIHVPGSYANTFYRFMSMHQDGDRHPGVD